MQLVGDPFSSPFTYGSHDFTTDLLVEWTASAEGACRVQMRQTPEKIVKFGGRRLFRRPVEGTQTADAAQSVVDEWRKRLG